MQWCWKDPRCVYCNIILLEVIVWQMSLMCPVITSHMTMRAEDQASSQEKWVFLMRWRQGLVWSLAILGCWSVNWTSNLGMKSCLYLNTSKLLWMSTSKFLFCGSVITQLIDNNSIETLLLYILRPNWNGKQIEIQFNVVKFSQTGISLA